MPLLNQTADRVGRVCLPASFANAPVVIEVVSATEVHIQLAQGATEDQTTFTEDTPTVLNDEERERFLALLDSPSAANAALRELARKYRDA